MKTRTHHRIILIGSVSVLTSLLILYYSSFTATLEDQMQSDGHQTNVLRQQTSHLEGYSSIIEHKPLRMHCRSCALVTSSGHMTGSDRGAEIDSKECVIRMNDAPTKGYQRDVGQRTSLRVVAHSSMQRVLRNLHELLNSSQDTFFIFWGPENYMRQDGKGLVYNNLRTMKQMMPKLQVYVISWLKMLHFDELFKKETGKDRKRSNSWLSTGWFTMAIAIEVCDRIDVYGMIPPEFCKSPKPSVPYHYYEPAGLDECTMYLSHEQGQHGSHHRFITEKHVFANWAQEKKKCFILKPSHCHSVKVMTMLSSKSNEEIRLMLDDYGIKHGPVVDSTRALYEKKLREAMTKQRRTKPQSNRTYYSEEEDEVTYVHHRRPQHYGDVSDRTWSDYRGMDYIDEPAIYRTQASYRNMSQTRNMSPEPQIQKTPEKSSSRLVPVWLQILVFLIVSVLLYFVFINMEPAEPVKRLT